MGTIGSLRTGKDIAENLPWEAGVDAEDDIGVRVLGVSIGIGRLAARLEMLLEERRTRIHLHEIHTGIYEARSTVVDASGGNPDPTGLLGQITTELEGADLKATRAEEHISQSEQPLRETVDLLRGAQARLEGFNAHSLEARDAIRYGGALAGDAIVSFDEAIAALIALLGPDAS